MTQILFLLLAVVDTFTFHTCAVAHTPSDAGFPTMTKNGS